MLTTDGEVNSQRYRRQSAIPNGTKPRCFATGNGGAVSEYASVRLANADNNVCFSTTNYASRGGMDAGSDRGVLDITSSQNAITSIAIRVWAFCARSNGPNRVETVATNYGDVT